MFLRVILTDFIVKKGKEEMKNHWKRHIVYILITLLVIFASCSYNAPTVQGLEQNLKNIQIMRESLSKNLAEKVRNGDITQEQASKIESYHDSYESLARTMYDKQVELKKGKKENE